jgi:hypothetical protein
MSLTRAFPRHLSHSPRFGSGARKSVAQALAAARLALGKRMYLAGIDDGQTCGAIDSLTTAMQESGIDANRRALLRAERERLFLQLADEALRYECPLPGAQQEYDFVRAILGTQIR